MDSGPTLKPKVTVKLNYKPSSTPLRPPSRDQNTNLPRPVSPVKHSLYSSPNDSTATFRPKSKVNSSATTRKGGVTVNAGSPVSSSASTTPRSGSPMKTIPRVRSVLSPTNPPKVSASASSVSRNPLSPPAGSAPATPETRIRALPPSSTLSGYSEESRSRAGSTVSLHHAVSFSSFHPPPSSNVSSSLASGSASASASPRLLSSKSVVGLGERSQTSSPTPRIRSKVTNLVKSATDSSASIPTPSSNLYPSSRNANLRARAPSTSSVILQQPTSPPPQFYPITTAVSAANPHRFPSARPPSTTRPGSSGGQPGLQALSPSGIISSTPSHNTRPIKLNGTAKVDPASIPLPPNSPPASTVSFSSRSSASASYLGAGDSHSQHSRAGSTSTDNGCRLSPSIQQKQKNSSPVNLRTTLDNLMQYSAETNSADDDDGDSGQNLDQDGEFKGTEEQKVKAAAKSNRKIADLEITNRSLLAINSSLEATKHRQAKEIHELRRKLRESRLILPPRVFKEVKLTDDAESPPDDDEDDEDVEDAQGDEIYKRIKVMLDTLLKVGQHALEAPVESQSESTRSATKVLSSEELKDYHGGDSEQAQEDDQEHEQDGGSEHNLLETKTHEEENLESNDIPYDDADPSFEDVGNFTLTSEDEVEAMTKPDFSPPSSPPPILIIQPA